MAEPIGAEAVVEHLMNCTDAKAALVMQSGSADGVVAEMLAEGWTLEDRVDYVAGKRIRFLRPPPPATQTEGGAS